MADEEEKCLLPKTNQKGELSQRSKWSSLVKLSIVLVLFKAGEDMYLAATKQYIYSWCERTLSGQKSSAFSTNNASNGTENATLCGQKDETEAQQQASRWELYLNLLNAVLVYFAVSIYGTLSDYYGRKRFFCLALFGFMVRCGVSAAVIYFDIHIAWMLVGYGADGVCGSLYMVSAITFASTADSTSRAQDRVFGMTVMETVFSAGRLITQFSNGYFIHNTGYFYPTLTATGILLVSFILGITIISEPSNPSVSSKPNDHKDNHDNQTSLPSIRTLFRRYVGFYVDSGEGGGRRIFWACLIAFFLLMFGIFSRSDPLILYQLGDPFCWSSELIGDYSAFLTFIVYVLGLLILKILQMCMSDPLIACLGTISAITYCALTGLAKSTVALFVAVVVGCAMELPKSILRGIASSKASTQLQGAMFAGLESSELICKMLASSTSLYLYAATVATDPGLVFIVLGGFYGLALVFLVYLYYLLRQRRHNDKIEQSVQNQE